MRSFSRVATSLTISRSSCGGNDDVDMVALWFKTILEDGRIELARSARRRVAEDLERIEQDCMYEKSAGATVDC